MEIAITKDQTIFLFLLSKIDEPEICRYIICLKNKKEKIEAYNYHYENWERIALSYFQCLKNRYPTYSYVLNGDQYIANPLLIYCVDDDYLNSWSGNDISQIKATKQYYGRVFCTSIKQNKQNL